jgi:hypothetical protein
MKAFEESKTIESSDKTSVRADFQESFSFEFLPSLSTVPFLVVDFAPKSLDDPCYDLKSNLAQLGLASFFP